MKNRTGTFTVAGAAMAFGVLTVALAQGTGEEEALDRRLDNIELSVQQLERNLMDLNRQVQTATSTASQAQRDAQMAQQMARDASLRAN